MSGHVIHNVTLARGAAANRRAPRTQWLAVFARMIRAIEERRLLATLDDRMLADVGLNRVDATREAARAPWDLTPPRS
jgi:uncharacterized protein YjiS (DUF1127 family)